MSDYTPIDCGIHDHLELTAMRGVPVAVEFVDPDGTPRTLADVRLDTIRVQDGGEYGVFAASDGSVTAIRLDRVATVAIPGGRLVVGGACTGTVVSDRSDVPGSALPGPSTPPACRPA